MAEVCHLAGGSIRVCMYPNEHGGPHFHVEYDSKWAKVAISDGSIIKGKLPGRQRRQVTKWTEDRRCELRAAWGRAERGEPVGKIAE